MLRQLKKQLAKQRKTVNGPNRTALIVIERRLKEIKAAAKVPSTPKRGSCAKGFNAVPRTLDFAVGVQAIELVEDDEACSSATASIQSGVVVIPTKVSKRPEAPRGTTTNPATIS